MVEFNQTDSLNINQNFNKLKSIIEKNNLRYFDCQFYEIDITAAVSNYKYPHNLGFSPKDIIQTSLTGSGSITFNYTSFDKTYLDITTTDACKVRFYAGTHRETEV